MKIKKAMNDALNKQLNEELESAYIYLGMAAHFEAQSLRGFANWFKKQAQEEVAHAMRFFDFINNREGNVKLFNVKAGPSSWKSPLAAFEAAYKHEQEVTAMIHRIVDMAAKQGDHATRVFLNWFVDEQVEEEAQTKEIVERLKMIGNSRSGLLVLDAELGKRED